MLIRIAHAPLYLALLIALTLPVGAEAAQPAGVSMTVEPHFGGHFKFGEWLPLRVTLANDGPPLNVEVRADTTEAAGQTTYVAPVELPTGARKRLTLYVLPPSFARTMRVRLMEGARELDSQSVRVSVERNINYLVGVIAPREAPFVSLNGLSLNPLSSGDGDFVSIPGFGVSQPRQVTAIPISLADIPDRPEGLRAIDALIISDSDTSGLTPEQASALRHWVENGGRLILGGGAGAARTLSGLPDALVSDFRSTGDTTQLDALDALGDFAQEEVRVAGPFVAAWPASGRALIEHSDGRLLLVERRLGAGHVNYAALDLAASPFDAWAGAARFWEKVLTPASAYPPSAPPDVSLRAMRANSLAYALQNLPVLDLPSIRSLGVLLAVYVVLVGPVNYLALRRLRKLAWGWITIGALTALFTVGAFATGFALRGGDVILNSISILSVDARGPTAPMQSYVGIFSPTRRPYTLSFPGGALVAPLTLQGDLWGGGPVSIAGTAEIALGDPTQVRNVQVDQWTLQGFQAESIAPDAWAIESDLMLDGERVYGTLVNRTGEAMHDVVIVYGSRFARLPDLSPGDSQTINLTWQISPGSSFPYYLFEQMWINAGPNGPPRDAQLRQQVLENYYLSYNGPPQPPSRPTLMGWVSASPLDVQVSDALWDAQATSLVIADLNTRYPPGPIHLSPGSLGVRLVELRGDASVCGPQPNQLYMFNGGATFEFQLPEELATLRVTSLTFIGSFQSGAPKFAVYTRDGEWLELDDESAAADLPDPARFILPDRVVRVRVDSQNGAGGCWLYDLDIEGVLPGSDA